LFAAADAAELGEEPEVGLPAMPLAEHVVTDYQTTRLSLKAHPMSFLRGRYRGDGLRDCREVSAQRDGAWAKLAGVVLVRQRPGNGNAVFMTLEDETGITNVVIWARLFQQFRREVMASRLIEVHGCIQRSPEGVVHLVARRLIDRSTDLHHLTDSGSISEGGRAAHHPRNVRIIPKSRDFH
jgi:error-prone DNA polymerase